MEHVRPTRISLTISVRVRLALKDATARRKSTNVNLCPVKTMESVPTNWPILTAIVQQVCVQNYSFILEEHLSIKF